MNKIIFILAVSMLMACKKESGNTGVIVKDGSSSVATTDSLPADTSGESSTAVREETYRYVADDGSSAHVTFGTSDDGKYISIRSNNKTINVKHKETTAVGDVYGEHDIIVNAEGDSLTITQAGNVIALKKARGQ